MVFVGVVNPITNVLCDEFLFSIFLVVNATTEAIFNALSVYSVSNNIRFTNIMGCPTDDVAATVRWHIGFDKMKGCMNSIAN